jgi:hypothetical protein
MGIVLSDRTNPATLTAWYASLETNHAHCWIPHAPMGYNCLGQVRSSGLLVPYRFFPIDPSDEENFLKRHFTDAQVKVVAQNLTIPVPADALYFALYGEGSNAARSLGGLEQWLRTNTVVNTPQP